MADAAITGLSMPRGIAIVGAGMVGLATAWFLQDYGVEVTVLDAEGVAAGSSSGNAGLLTPSLASPLPEPAVLKYAVRAVLGRSSPVAVTPRFDARLLRFLAGFVRRSTLHQWQKAMHSMVTLNRLALESFDLLGDGGVDAMTREAQPLLAAYRTVKQRGTLLAEIEHIQAAGQSVAFEALTGDEAREIEPSLSDTIGAAIQLHGQRFIDPAVYVHALAASVRARGGTIQSGARVTAVSDTGTAVRLAVRDGAGGEYDAVVLATGAWLGDLARQFGVRSVVQAGRGYSFSIAVDHLPARPLYFPIARVACTPIGDRVRVAGTMEFRAPEAPPNPRHIHAVSEAIRPLLRGAHVDDRDDEWVGSRPCTTDGLPLIGATRSSRVFIAGGHGMWGMTLGPATGRLLAAQIVTGKRVADLAPFDPLR